MLREPVPVKQLSSPVLLVEREKPIGLLGPGGEELHYFSGPPAISLFTGCGGMDLGLEAAGFCVVLQHEWNDVACETLIGNRDNFFRDAALIQGDIRQTTTSAILKAAGLRVGECKLITGGPPCQGFSSANKHAVKGRYDGRNDLVFEFLRVVREAQPEFFLFENVPGFVRFNKHEYLKAFLERAHGAFYELVYALVDAVEYGVPQYRCRFLCMGTRRDLHEIDGLLGAFPAPETFQKHDLKLIRAQAPEARHITRPPGIRYFSDRPLLIPPAPIRHGQEGGRIKKFIEFYERLEREEPDRIIAEPQGGSA